MPLLKPRRSFLSEADIDIYVWHATESVAALRGLLPPGERFQEGIFDSCGSEKRVKEQLAERLLLRTALGDSAEIRHLPTGRPVLRGVSREISVSHSHGYVALALADRRIGIDLEACSHKAMRVQEKFLSPIETALMPEQDAATATLLWCAKEAAYKRFDVPGTFLRDGIRLDRCGDGIEARHQQTGQRTRILLEARTDFALACTLD